MIAAFPMYDWPQATAAHDRLWATMRDLLRDAGHTAPEHLSRGSPLWEVWESPDLLIAQTCGLPYRTRLHGRVTLVGTPDYALPGSSPGQYYSEALVRADETGQFKDFANRILAFNGQDSQSGWAAAQNHAASHGFRFTHTLHTGSHRESARAVADGRADIAVVDAVTWRLFCAHLPDEAAHLRVVDHTEPTPGLPVITAVGRDAEPLRIALAAAISALSPAERQALGGLCGLVAIPDAAYLAVPTPPPPSQDAPAT